VAAPTAGLHFTPDLIERLRRNGVEKIEITLHVGPGTFRPVSVDDPADHRMDSERYEISPEAAWKINIARRTGRRVIAVGTTSVRTLETAVRSDGRVAAGGGRSELFIRSPYEFGCIGAMLTNFHLPRSTLLMLVCAFAGREFVLEAYATAVREGYRFYSYGDCLLIL
jgi:S-adenosylmethionine:tRNA ribosyltransferase-isomerase